MQKNILAIGIIILFILSALAPMATGYNEIKQPSILNSSNTSRVVRFGNPPIANFTMQNDSDFGIVTFDGSLSYDLDGEIVSYEWDFGDGKTGNGKYTYHQYCAIGTYDVTLTVTDNDGLKGNLTKCVDVILANYPPPVTVIDGPTSGKVGTEYEYIFHVIFPEDIIVFLLIDWGDGNNTEWIGPYWTFDFITLSHSWSKKGTYLIKAKVKDFCREGAWGFLVVTMPRNKEFVNSLLLWFLERFPLLERLLNLI